VRGRWRWVLLALGCLTLAWVFAKLGGEVLEGELFPLDNAVRHWMLAHRNPALIAVFSVLTELGAKELLAPLGIVIAWKIFRDPLRLGLLLAFCAIAAGEFVAVLKRQLHVVRPAGGRLEHLGFSFPSGHSTGSMAVAVVLSYLAVKHRRHTRAIIVTCAAVVLLVGFSRLYLDVHWASDVLGGWLIGAAFGVGVCALTELVGPAPVTDAARSP
jgi:membrane-associated phospholipid phosphatase